MSEPDIRASPGLEAGVGLDRGFENGEDLDTFFQESQLEEPNLGGGEALTAQHIHEIPDIPMEMLQALKGGDEQVGQEPSPARRDPRGQGDTSVSLEVDRHRNERASTESAEGTLLGHDQIVTSEPLVQPPIVPDLDSFFTESAAGLTRSANASAQEESTIRGAVEAALGSPAGDRPELREALPASAPSESDERVKILERQLANLLASIPANAANSSDPRVDTLEREFAHIHERENAQDSHLKEIGAMLTSLVQNSSAADEKFAMISARMTEQEAGSNYLQQASLFASSEKVKSLEQVVEASRKKDRVLKAHIQEFSALLDTVILRKSPLDTAQTSRGTLRPASRVVAETATPSTRSMSASPGESRQKEFRFSNSGEIHVSEGGVEAVRGEASSEPPHDQKIVEDFLKLSCEDDSPLGRTQGVVLFPSEAESGSRSSWHKASYTEGDTLRSETQTFSEPSFDEIFPNSPTSLFPEDSSAVSFFPEEMESEGEDSPIFASKDTPVSSSRKSNPFSTTVAAMRLKATASRQKALREKEAQGAREAELPAAPQPGGTSSPFLAATAATRLKAAASRKKAQREKKLQEAREAELAAAPQPGGTTSPFLAATAAMRLKAAASRKREQRKKNNRGAWEEEMAESLLQQDDIERCIETITSTKKPSLSTAALAATAAMRLKSYGRRSDDPGFAVDEDGREQAHSPLITEELLEAIGVGVYSSDSESDFEDVTLRLFKSPAPARSRSRSPQRPPWYPPGGKVPN